MILPNLSRGIKLDYATELVLAGLPVVFLPVFIYWTMRLRADVKSGRRMSLKWKDLSLPKRIYNVTLVGYFALIVFFDFSTIIPRMTETGMPFIAELQNAIISIWLATAGLVGLGLLLTMKSPVVGR
jgi:hypothetical protein